MAVDNVSNYIIVGICIIILVSFIIWISWVNYTNTDNTITYLTCPADQCAVNIYNGEKRCPLQTSTSVIYDPSFENCTHKFSCDSTLAPYAIRSDGSTNDYGQCEDGVACRCSANPQCPLGEVVLFNVVGGNIYANNTAEDNIIFYQNPVQNQGDTQPIVYTDPNFNFCSIPASYLNRLSPGPCVFNDANNITTPEIVSCIKSNPCVIGVLAFKPLNIADFNLSNTDTSAIYFTNVGCVAGNTINGKSADCTLPNQIALWNPKTANITCYSVN